MDQFTEAEQIIIKRYLQITNAKPQTCECDCGAIINKSTLERHKLSSLHKNRLEWGDDYKKRLSTQIICECGGKTSLKTMKQHITTARHQKYINQ